MEKKKKISSQTKKEMENFIPASLKRHFFQKTQLYKKIQLCKFLRQRVIHQVTYHLQFIQSRCTIKQAVGHGPVTLYKIKKEYSLLRRPG